METDATARRRRVPAQLRREQMLRVAIDLARRDGSGCVTLARVAEASGVSKPVAYEHFGTLPGLLAAMYERIGAEYEQTVLGQVRKRMEEGADRSALVGELCREYVDCSLSSCGLHDEINAALVAAGAQTQTSRVDTPSQYVGLVTELFGLDEPSAYRMATAFLGAADRICEATIAGRVQRDQAIATLASLFMAQVPENQV